MPGEAETSSRIFISYRREDSSGHVLALLPSLRSHFGADRIFKDTDNIPPGADFLKFIKSELESCSVLLAIIGREWLTIQDPRLQRRRLDNPDDFLRVEVATALKNERIRVIPILIERAPMPAAQDLPSDLSELAFRNAVELSDGRWESDVRLLIEAIEHAVAESVAKPQAPARPELMDLQKHRTREIASQLANARQAFESGDFEGTLYACDKALLLDPQTPDVLDLMDRARKALDERKINAWLGDARRALGQGDIGKASDLIDQALSVDRDSKQALTIRGEMLELRAQEDERRRTSQKLQPSRAAAAAEPKPVATDENVQFTVFRRSAIQPEHWYPLLAFAHLAERRSDAPPDEPDPIEEVQTQARQLLGDDMGKFRSATEDSGYPVAREGELRFVPHMDGVTFNPPERRFLWTENVHREDFRLRADKSMDGHVARGAVSVFYGNLLLAEVQLSIKVDRKSAASHQEETHARPYRRIFASYSHRDTAIVEEFERHAVATGDRYLRDVVTLRAGEVWDQRLLEIMKQADVFQLFWSWNALSSPLVREEWRQALALNRPHFVRPVYWEEPLPEQAGLPPIELRRLHFQRVYPRISSPPLPPALPSSASETKILQSPALETPADVRRAPISPISRLISYGSAAAVLVAAVGLYFTVLNGPPAAEQSAPQVQTDLPSTAPSSGGAVATTPSVQNPAAENPPAATAIPPSAAVKTPTPAPVVPPTTSARRGAPPSPGGTSAPATSKPSVQVPLSPAPSEERRVRGALERYESAYDNLDAAAVRALFPGAPADLTGTFAQYQFYRLELVVQKITLAPDLNSATAVCRVSHFFQPKIGKTQQYVRTQEFTFEKHGDSWVIARIR